jgi:hypothetical protein
MHSISPLRLEGFLAVTKYVGENMRCTTSSSAWSQGPLCTFAPIPSSPKESLTALDEPDHQFELALCLHSMNVSRLTGIKSQVFLIGLIKMKHDNLNYDQYIGNV